MLAGPVRQEDAFPLSYGPPPQIGDIRTKLCECPHVTWATDYVSNLVQLLDLAVDTLGRPSATLGLRPDAPVTADFGISWMCSRRAVRPARGANS